MTLRFEERRYRYAGKRETDVREIFGESLIRYSQRLDALIDRPDADAAVNSTASLAFVDVRTGFTYGATQATATVAGLADAWDSAAALDAKRLDAERQAFAALLVAAEKSWSGIVGRYR